MSLHILSIALISISSNTDSFAVAIAYGIKKIRITIPANLLIAVVSSLGTFLSISVGQMISGYLPRSTASILGSGVLISIGIFGMWQTIRQEHKRRRIEKYNQPWYLRLKVARLGEDAECAQRPIALATAIAFKTTMVLSI